MAKAKLKKNKAQHPRISELVVEGWTKYKDGFNRYMAFQPQPPIPTEELADAPESFMFYGWMMARAHDVTRIQRDLRSLNLSEKKYNTLMNKRVAALDRSHDQKGNKVLPVF
jgi:hypothetical protein